MIRQEIVKLIAKATAVPEEKVRVTYPEGDGFGDYTTNVALQLKKPANEIVDNLKSDLFEKIEVAGPGFINFFLSKEFLQKQVGIILKEKNKFGQLKIGKGEKVNIEFISANPTGPLHIGNGRGGYCGDVLANVFDKAGYKVVREYYVNDRGRQIKFLQDTLNGNVVYKNEYTDELVGKKEKNVDRAVKEIVGKIKKTTERMGIKFDHWFLETSLYPKETDEAIKFLKKKNLIFEKDGAVWFRSTDFGDDKDRVLIRATEKTTYEEETYLLSDIAYLRNKLKRKFGRLIVFLGAEHHGYVPRLKAAVKALDYDPRILIPIVYQLVRLIKDGQEVRMSKRSGNFVTIEDLLDEINNDVARFFFLSRSADSHLNFDLNLAKTQSEKNPVYYVQYAHARICSILRKSKMLEAKPRTDLLGHPTELKLIRQLIRLPEVIEDTAKDYQVQRLPQYAVDLATAFHQFYRDCKVLSEVEGLQQARLSLVLATKIVLENTLSLMGISAPEKM